MSLLEICIVALAGFCSSLIKTGVGIGAGIFLLPTLALAFPAKLALGLGAPLLLASDVIGIHFYWKQWIAPKQLVRLMAAAAPGLVLGTLLLPVIPAGAFRFGVGLFGMAYAISYLFPLFTPVRLLKKAFSGFNRRAEAGQVYFYGALGGVATVLAHAGGLVWSLYLTTATRDRRVFVGTVVLLFFVSDIYKTLAYVAIGTMPATALLSILPAVPAVWVGSAIGNRLNKRVNQELFRRLVLGVILIISAKLCW
jgi:uncharacterized membrane protein YfcA